MAQQPANDMVSMYGVYDYGGYDKEYDIIICGGGTAGVAAAISAARIGGKVLMIERAGLIGGQMNLSGPPGFAYARMFNASGQQDTGGIVEETHKILYREGHALPHLRPEHRARNGYTFSYVDPDWWTFLIYDMMEKYGVTMLLDTQIVGVEKDGDKACGVVVVGVDGKHIIPCKIVIDCTGEGYASEWAGCDVVWPDRDIIQPHSICFTADGINWDKLIKYINNNPEQFTWQQLASSSRDPRTKEWVMAVYRAAIDIKELGEVMGFFDLKKMALENGDWHPNSGAGFFLQPKGDRILAHFQHSSQVDHSVPNDPWDMTRCNIECRKQIVIAWRFFKNYVPGFENAYITKQGTEIRIREGGRVMGDYMLTKEDVRDEARFPDVIGMSSFPAGAHHTTNTNTIATVNVKTKDTDNNVQVQNKGDFESCKDHGSYAIPYRCMVPKKVENMLVAGKCMSTDRSAYLRYLQQTMVTGQAAGVAAQLCVKNGITPREMEKDVTELQKILVQQGAILSLPTDKIHYGQE